jgi:hypothetical protein
MLVLQPSLGVSSLDLGRWFVRRPLFLARAAAAWTAARAAQKMNFISIGCHLLPTTVGPVGGPILAGRKKSPLEALPS